MLERVTYDSVLGLCRGFGEIHQGKSYPIHNDYDKFIRKALIVAGVADITFAALQIAGRNVSSIASFALFGLRCSISIAGMDGFHTEQNAPQEKWVKLTRIHDGQIVLIARSLLGTTLSLVHLPKASLYVRNFVATLDVLMRIIK